MTRNVDVDLGLDVDVDPKPTQVAPKDRVEEILDITRQLFDMQEADHKRLVRVETRLARTMKHFGLRADGSPVEDKEQPT